MPEFTTLLFDLDDTLYPATSGLWELIGERINQYMITRVGLPAEGIGELREALFKEYGTTLRGLKVTRGIDEHDYLDFVHNVPVHEYIQPASGLAEMLASLPQERVIFTNADTRHARRVLAALEISEYFQQIIDILAIAPWCKPQPEAYRVALEQAGVNHPGSAVVIDDSLRNLATAKALGCATVHVGPPAQREFIDISIPDIIHLPDAIRRLE